MLPAGPIVVPAPAVRSWNNGLSPGEQAATSQYPFGARQDQHTLHEQANHLKKELHQKKEGCSTSPVLRQLVWH